MKNVTLPVIRGNYNKFNKEMPGEEICICALSSTKCSRVKLVFQSEALHANNLKQSSLSAKPHLMEN